MTEKVISFHQLCAIKREQRALGIHETGVKVGYTNYSMFERGLANPSQRSKKKLIQYFGITPQELASCTDHKTVVHPPRS